MKRYRKKYQTGGQIEGPVGFLKSYYTSPKFKERAKNSGTSVDPNDILKHIDNVKAYQLPEGYSDLDDETPIGSKVWDDIMTKAFIDKGLNNNTKIPLGTNLLLDPDQAKDLGIKMNSKVNYLLNDVYPHELTHLTGRNLNPTEEFQFVFRNRMKINDKMAGKEFFSPEFSKWKEDRDKFNLPTDFSSYVKRSDSGHDLAPDENYADIGALRYMLWKEGIYDARSQDFNKDFLKKAKENKYLKSSFTFDRLQKTFTDDDLVELMNKIAKNNQKSNPMAQMGGSVSKMGYRRDSPYKDNPYLDIFSPEGIIDMSHTDKDLVGVDEYGHIQHMAAGSKIPYVFKGQQIREIPLTEMVKGGLTPAKAHEMLKDGTAHGKKLTKKQKRYFGYVYGSSKKEYGGLMDNPYKQQGGVQDLFNYLFEDDDPQSEQALQTTAPDTDDVDMRTQELDRREQDLMEQEQYNQALMVAMQNGENPFTMGQTPTGGQAPSGFRTFGSYTEGRNALENQLELYKTGKTKNPVKPTTSLLDAMSVYAPASDGNDPVNYANFVARRLGVSVTTPIHKLDTKKWADAIEQMEGNKRGNNPGNLR